MFTLLVRSELLGEQRSRERAPGNVRRVGERVEGLAHVRKTGREGPEVLDSALERELAVDVAELVRERPDGPAVEVEPARWVAAGCEKEERAPRRRPPLVLVDRDVLTGDRGENDQRRGERFGSRVVGERPLELGQPGWGGGHAVLTRRSR